MIEYGKCLLARMRAGDQAGGATRERWIAWTNPLGRMLLTAIILIVSNVTGMAQAPKTDQPATTTPKPPCQDAQIPKNAPKSSAQPNSAQPGSASQNLDKKTVSGAGHSAPILIPEPSEELMQDFFRNPKSSVLSATLGGRQFWGDVQLFHHYRIQKNVFTGHYRLLDALDRRVASGTFEECQTRLKEIQIEDKLPPMSGTCVIFVHGIVRSSKSMRTLSHLAEAHGMLGLEFDYPSTQADIAACAEYLHEVISRLEGVEKIHLIVHSMGGLVVRSYFEKHNDPRLGRLVMLGTPNQGARMADHLKGNLLFKTVFGPAGQQLVTHEAGVIPKLPTPKIEFGIIAGARGDGKGWNPFIAGDDDGTVEITSTRLAGAKDFFTLPVIHSFMMRDATVGEYSMRFLETGAFREDGTTQPILITEPEPVPVGSP